LIAKYAVIDLDTPIADKFGEIKTNLRRAGFILADFDLLIGATAIATARTLVTNNTKHFQRLATYGLTLENWRI
jgi:predicted nucleic acid-binding protein